MSATHQARPVRAARASTPAGSAFPPLNSAGSPVEPAAFSAEAPRTRRRFSAEEDAVLVDLPAGTRAQAFEALARAWGRRASTLYERWRMLRKARGGVLLSLATVAAPPPAVRQRKCCACRRVFDTSSPYRFRCDDCLRQHAAWAGLDG